MDLTVLTYRTKKFSGHAAIGETLTKFHRSQKCCTRSTTLGPIMVNEVSCQAERPHQHERCVQSLLLMA